MYKYNYLFDADEARTFAASRNAVSVEMVGLWVNDPTSYQPQSLTDVLRINEMKRKEERKRKFQHFWNKRGTNPIQKVELEYAD